MAIHRRYDGVNARRFCQSILSEMPFTNGVCRGVAAPQGGRNGQGDLPLSAVQSDLDIHIVDRDGGAIPAPAQPRSANRDGLVGGLFIGPSRYARD
jgi:hypothetical protein